MKRTALTLAIAWLGFVNAPGAHAANTDPFDFDYEIVGGISERPALVFNDGSQTFIQPRAGQVITAEGGHAQGPYIVVDGTPEVIRYSVGGRAASAHWNRMNTFIGTTGSPAFARDDQPAGFDGFTNRLVLIGLHAKLEPVRNLNATMPVGGLVKALVPQGWTGSAQKDGDGLQLITRVNRMGLYRLMTEIDGKPPVRSASLAVAGAPAAPSPKRRADPAFVERRLNSMWERSHMQREGDLSRLYLHARVPGLSASPSKSLRLGMLEYRHEKKVIGMWPGILAKFELPDGRLGTLHRTFLERSVPRKARIVSADGELLDNKLNDMTLNPLRGGAVRLMEPVNGEIGVAEGLETAYAAHMEFGVPMWNCLNRILLSQFVVPDALGIRVVHIFVDFDDVDPKNGKSPGVAAGVELAKRLRAEGFTALIHRPKKRGTDFADEWLAKFAMPASLVPVSRSVGTDRPMSVAA